MRETLFRGKRVDNGEWVEGDFCRPSNICKESIGYDEQLKQSDVLIWEDYSVQPETVGQYTGLTDKNGKKIFEGDVVKVNGVANAKVFYRNEECCYAFDYIGGRPLIVDLVDDRSLEVIGNIHDNPELLK